MGRAARLRGLQLLNADQIRLKVTLRKQPFSCISRPMALAPSPAISANTRLDKLNVAATLHGFDKSLERSAWGSLGWGAFSLLVGLFLLSRGRFGWINILFG